MKMKLLLTTISFLFIFTGCSHKADLSNLNVSEEPIYPPISVVLKSEGRKHFPYRDSLLSALREANVFKSVDVGDTKTDYEMEVYLDVINISMQDNNPAGYVKAFIAGFTWMLVPMPIEFVTKGTVKLSYQGNVFEEFDIESNYKTFVSLYTANDKDVGAPGAYRKAVEIIIEEIMERNSFNKITQDIH